jgi:hypothetical protein
MTTFKLLLYFFLITISISTEMLSFDDALVLGLLMLGLLGVIINKMGTPFVEHVQENSKKLASEFSMQFTVETEHVKYTFLKMYAISICFAFLDTLFTYAFINDSKNNESTSIISFICGIDHIGVVDKLFSVYIRILISLLNPWIRLIITVIGTILISFYIQLAISPTISAGSPDIVHSMYTFQDPTADQRVIIAELEGRLKDLSMFKITTVPPFPFEIPSSPTETIVTNYNNGILASQRFSLKNPTFGADALNSWESFKALYAKGEWFLPNGTNSYVYNGIQLGVHDYTTASGQGYLLLLKNAVSAQTPLSVMMLLAYDSAIYECLIGYQPTFGELREAYIVIMSVITKY